MAFLDAASRAKPVLLEPVMQVQVSVPMDTIADVVENQRRQSRLAGGRALEPRPTRRDSRIALPEPDGDGFAE